MTTPESSASHTPSRIDLEDFIAAVTRGVARALAEQEDVAGFAAANINPQINLMQRPPILVGIFPNPPGSITGVENGASQQFRQASAQ